jgi:hypothetical protein
MSVAPREMGEAAPSCLPPTICPQFIFEQGQVWARGLLRPQRPYDLLSCLLRSVPIARAQALSRASVSFDGTSTNFGAVRAQQVRPSLMRPEA